MRRAMQLRPVNSFKRIIDTSGGLSAGSVSTTTLAGTGARTDADPTGSTEVPVGGHLSAIFYSVYIYSDAIESTSPLTDMYWWKNPGGALFAPTAGNTDGSNKKPDIIH